MCNLLQESIDSLRPDLHCNWTIRCYEPSQSSCRLV